GRQFSFRCDAPCLFNIDDSPAFAESEILADLHACERNFSLNALLKCDGVNALRFTQPASVPVIKQEVPLVPDSVFILKLDTADHREVNIVIAPPGSKLNRRTIWLEVGHHAEVFDIEVLANQCGPAV